jgi:hypothetical protein
VEALVVGTRAAVLFLIFGLIAAACTSSIDVPANAPADAQTVGQDTAAGSADTNASAKQPTGADGDDVSVATNLNVVHTAGGTTVQTGSAGSALNISVGNQVGNAVVAGDQTANSADISVAGASVSVVSNVAASSSVSVTSSSTSSDGSSVVNVSVTTGSGSVNRTVRFDGAGRFVLRVTAGDDGLPVIQVEEVGP